MTAPASTCFAHLPALAIAVGLVLGSCGEDSPEPCPHTATWTEEIQITDGGEVGTACIPVLLFRDASGEVDCEVVEVIDPDFVGGCDAIPGRVADGIDEGLDRPRCVVNQVTTSAWVPPAEPAGWYYDDFSPDTSELCRESPQRLTFTEGAQPRIGSVVKVECAYSTQGRGSEIGLGTYCGADPSICQFPSAEVRERFPTGLACDDRDTPTCQALCRSSADCPAEYDCLDANDDGTRFCVDPRCVDTDT